MEKGIHVSSAHILGKQNILADTVSTKSHDVSEWMLSKNIFSHLVACFGMHEVDFFLRLDLIGICIDIFPGCLILMLYMMQCL